MKKILVFVSGISPAIITETVYALAKAPYYWSADEIVVFTTSVGAQKIKEQLLDSNIYQDLCDELGINTPFTFNDIQVPLVKGVVLNDIRNQNDNTEFADFVSQGIHRLTRENTQLYVSLAGGRKTMGYYIGYALSLFGRVQDKLLHVLINEPFEQISTFYYPNKNGTDYILNNGKVIKSNQAIIELAEIPFIRLKHAYPEALIKTGKFAEAVMGIQDQLSSKNKSKLVIKQKTKIIVCDGVDIKLTTYRMILYSYFVSYLIENQKGVVINNINPNKLEKEINAVDRMAISLVDSLNKVKNSNGNRFSSTENAKKYLKNIRSEITRINKMLDKKLGTHSIYFKIYQEESNYQIRVPIENITIE